MRHSAIAAAGFLAAVLAATPARAQAGHGTHAPLPARDTAKAAGGHEGHGKAGTTGMPVAKDAAAAHAAHGMHGTAGSATMEHTSGWKELDAYHMVMMQVWHPAKEKGDLAPIRARASALAASADSVAAATVPAACDTPVNRAEVAKVQAESRALAGLVAGNASDEAVLAALRSLHERFETVNRGCVAK